MEEGMMMIQDPFHHAKIYIHKEVANRDAKINELLAQVENCHQQINAMHSEDPLRYMQVKLNQQMGVHQKTRDEMDAMNLEYQNLFAQFIQKNEQYQQLESIIRRNERLVEEADLKTQQCQEMWLQVRHQAERYRKLETELKCDSAMKFKKDKIMKRLADEARCLTSSLNKQREQKQQQQKDAKYEKHLLAEFESKESLLNPMEHDKDLELTLLANHCDKELISKAQTNPFSRCSEGVTPKENLYKNKVHTSKVHSTYSKVQQSYQKELQKVLGLDVPINPFKRETIADNEDNERYQWNHFQIENKAMATTADDVGPTRNNQDFKKDSSHVKTSAAPTSPAIRVIEDDGNSDNGIPEKYKNLPSNVYLNPFKCPNASSLNRNKNNNHNMAQKPNKKRPSKTLIKHHPTTVDSDTQIERPNQHHYSRRTWVQHTNVATNTKNVRPNEHPSSQKTWVKRPNVASNTQIECLNELPAVDSNTWIKRPSNTLKTWVKHPNNNRNPWLKRRGTDNHWQSNNINFKRSKQTDDQQHHQQQQQQQRHEQQQQQFIPNVTEVNGNKFNSSMGGMGGNEGGK